MYSVQCTLSVHYVQCTVYTFTPASIDSVHYVQCTVYSQCTLCTVYRVQSVYIMYSVKCTQLHLEQANVTLYTVYTGQYTMFTVGVVHHELTSHLKQSTSKETV